MGTSTRTSPRVPSSQPSIDWYERDCFTLDEEDQHGDTHLVDQYCTVDLHGLRYPLSQLDLLVLPFDLHGVGLVDAVWDDLERDRRPIIQTDGVLELGC